MTEQTKLKLETDYIPIESTLCQDLIYCIRKDGQGMHVISGEQELAVRSEYVVDFIKEWFEIWIMYGEKVKR